LYGISRSRGAPPAASASAAISVSGSGAFMA
jgi:hypothetical protein